MYTSTTLQKFYSVLKVTSPCHWMHPHSWTFCFAVPVSWREKFYSCERGFDLYHGVEW